MAHRGNSKPILSARQTLKIEALYALVVTDTDGREGIVRRDTPSGTQPWITDDFLLIEQMLALAQADAPPFRVMRIVEFERTGSWGTGRRKKA